MHPRLSDLYQKKIAELAEALNRPALKQQATELLSGLISEVRMVPDSKATGCHEIELAGDLAGIFLLAEADTAKPPHRARAGAGLGSETVVAGACPANCFAMSKAVRPEIVAGAVVIRLEAGATPDRIASVVRALAASP